MSTEEARAARSLCQVLTLVRQSDVEHHYEERNSALLHALSLATHAGFACGVRIDTEEPGWPVLFIELPTGQVSWHLPQHATPWDGHTKQEKDARVDAWIEQMLQEANTGWTPSTASTANPA